MHCSLWMANANRHRLHKMQSLGMDRARSWGPRFITLEQQALVENAVPLQCAAVPIELCHKPNAMCFVVLPLPVVHYTINSCMNTNPMLKTETPLSDINVPISRFACALAVAKVILK